MSQEEISYRQSRIKVQRHRTGWMALVFVNGSGLASGQIPSTARPDGRESVIAEAKTIIDRAAQAPA